MISICLATFNGEIYIEEQLKSILEQTLQPDEVIICDDCSKDNTTKIVEKFIFENQLDNKWKLIKNEINKGYPENFYFAIQKCKNDLIFFCDQDDIWNKFKIEKMNNVFKTRKSIKLLSCGHDIINSKGRKITNFSLIKNLSIRKIKAIKVADVLNKFVWPGMSMAIRKEHLDLIFDNFEISNIPHDFALALISADQNAFFYYDFKGVHHRRHDSNTAKEVHQLSKVLNIERKKIAIRSYIDILRLVIERSLELSVYNRELVKKRHVISVNRLNILENKNIYLLFKLYLKDIRVIRFESFLSDLLGIIFSK